ncbi:MAG: hypothetical protein N2035_10365 [Chthoniobacterales bacterium]|nr:hypothetical protein [Chthoniobacterales bacterium]
MNQREDQVLCLSLGPAEARSERTITALGQPYQKFQVPCSIV